MKKILFLSCCIPNELENELTQFCKYHHNINDAANTFQKTIIHGFIENEAVVNVVSAPSLPTYLKGYNRLFIPNLHTMIEGKVSCDILPYCTFILGKYVDMERRVIDYTSNWIRANANNELSIIAYNINPAFMSALKKIKKIFPNVQTALIVTDMIEDAMNFKVNRGVLKRIQFYLHRKKVFSSYVAIDKYILLSEQMKERIPNCKDNFVVIEGVYAPQKNEHVGERDKVIFYSGVLDSFANIVEMIEAFKNINRDDYRLVICGRGPLSEYVKKESELNSNIEFLGTIPRSEVLLLQKKSSLLINPRQPSEITKYSFPSKTMEYFASGTPVLMYRLQGIPDEYYSYCYTIKGVTIKDFSASLEQVLSLSEQKRNELGLKAKDFILCEKNSKKQIQKLVNFL